MISDVVSHRRGTTTENYHQVSACRRQYQHACRHLCVHRFVRSYVLYGVPVQNDMEIGKANVGGPASPHAAAPRPA